MHQAWIRALVCVPGVPKLWEPKLKTLGHDHLLNCIRLQIIIMKVTQHVCSLVIQSCVSFSSGFRRCVITLGKQMCINACSVVFVSLSVRSSDLFSYLQGKSCEIFNESSFYCKISFFFLLLLFDTKYGLMKLSVPLWIRCECRLQSHLKHQTSVQKLPFFCLFLCFLYQKKKNEMS